VKTILFLALIVLGGFLVYSFIFSDMVTAYSKEMESIQIVATSFSRQGSSSIVVENISKRILTNIIISYQIIETESEGTGSAIEFKTEEAQTIEPGKSATLKAVPEESIQSQAARLHYRLTGIAFKEAPF